LIIARAAGHPRDCIEVDKDRRSPVERAAVGFLLVPELHNSVPGR